MGDQVIDVPETADESATSRFQDELASIRQSARGGGCEGGGCPQGGGAGSGSFKGLGDVSKMLGKMPGLQMLMAGMKGIGGLIGRLV